MPAITIVIPMQNESGNVAPVIAEVVEALRDGPEWEIVTVDDGSTDATRAELMEVAGREPRLRVLANNRAAGKSAAIHNGVLVARADIVCTIDGDGQNPPQDLAKLYEPLLQDTTGRLGLVAGQRVGRRDTTAKKIASRIANRLRARLLADGTRDTACGMKAFRREGWLALPFYDNMHRYMPALFRRDGWEVRLIEVGDRDRMTGASKYTNLERALVGAFDLAGTVWLVRRRRKAEAREVTATTDAVVERQT